MSQLIKHPTLKLIKHVNKWFRWGAAGVFGLMLTLNVMVGLDFEKDKVLPTVTLVELGNQANAQSESGGESCPEYTEQYEYAPMIKWCRNSQSFKTWEDCEFKMNAKCPCPSVHEENC